jgi:hypothetical protein
MIEIVLTVCAIAAPSSCHDERFKVFDESLSVLQCLMSAPAAIADSIKWQQSHPGWRVDGWTCREFTPEKDT